MTTLWIRDPQTIPPPKGRNRTIGVRPLIDLKGLQACLSTGVIDPASDEGIWVATRRTEAAFQRYGWTQETAAQMIGLLNPEPWPKGNFKKAEWCEVAGGQMYPSDVYVLRYDEARKTQSANGLEVYVKFSLDSEGALMLVLVSCHP